MAAITARQRTGWATANFVVIALALIPVLWLVSLSFKTPTAVLDPSFIPSQWTWGNYHGILTSSQFIRPLVNSIGIGIISTLIAVILASMAAYAVARLRFPGKSVLIGMALLIGAYALVTAGRLQGPGLTFQLMNLFGGAFLMVNSAYYGAWPSAALNVVWVIIGVVGLARARLRARPPVAVE